MSKLPGQAKRFWKRNGSTIMTIAGGVGVVATAVAAAKATPKALLALEYAKQEKGEDLTAVETIRVAAPVYIPTVLLGASTIACVVGSQMMNKKYQAQLVGAYTLLDQSYKEYKGKVKELYGEEGQTKVREGIAKDKYEEDEIIVSEDKELFYDEFLGQYFQSTIEEVQRAHYILNREIQMGGSYSAVEFYDMLGIDYDDGGALGWSEGGNFARYWQSWVDFSTTKTMLDENLECTIITCWSEPYMEFDEY